VGASVDIAAPDPQVRAPRAAGEVLRDVVSLTKPRLAGLVVFTTAGATALAPGALSGWTWLWVLLGTAGVVAGAHVFNCVLERDVDGLMARTATRPLPARRLPVGAAVVFGAALLAGALPMLWWGVNPLTAALGGAALILYVLVYTPMKRRTDIAMLVGAIPGALPPLMGWTAATGRIEAGGLVLFVILFLWQLPHFIAIALFRKDEYRAAGLTSVPLQRGDDAARLQAVLYLAALLPVSALPTVVGVAGPVYLAVALGLGAWFTAVGVQGWRRRGDERWARRLFGASLVYLTGLFAALGVSGALGL
jgi:protoheme IX farnesyltransferase